MQDVVDPLHSPAAGAQVCDAAPHEADSPPYRREVLAATGREIVQDHDIVPRADQVLDQVRPDEPRASRDQTSHGGPASHIPRQTRRTDPPYAVGAAREPQVFPRRKGRCRRTSLATPPRREAGRHDLVGGAERRGERRLGEGAHHPPRRRTITGTVRSMIRRSSNADWRRMYSRAERTLRRTSPT